MEQGAEERLTESKCQGETRQIDGDRGQQRTGESEFGWSQREEQPRQNLAAGQKDRDRADQTGRTQSFMGIAGQSPPNLSLAGVHPTGGNARGVEKVSAKTGGAKSPWQMQTVVQRGAKRAMTSGGAVRTEPDQEELTAARGERKAQGSSHLFNRQKTKQDKVNQGDEEFFRKRTRLLPGNATDQIGLGGGQARNHPTNGIRAESNISVHEQSKGMRCLPSQHLAGVLFAAPARRQCRHRN